MGLDTLRKVVNEKADISLQMLNDDGGVLAPEVGEKFIRDVIVAAPFLSAIRTKIMSGPTAEMPKIAIGERVMHGAPPAGTELSSAKNVSVSTGKVELSTKKGMAVISIPYDVFEDNVEKDQIANTIMAMAVAQIAPNIESIVLHGDTAIDPATDDLLCLWDGVFKTCTANVVDNTLSPLPVTSDRFAEAVKALPEKYMMQLPQMAHWCSKRAEIDLSETLKDRLTGLGDAAMVQKYGGIPMSGVPVKTCYTMPSNLMLLTDPKNIILGIQRNIMIERVKFPKLQVIEFVITMRIDTTVQTPEAVVVTKGLELV